MQRIEWRCPDCGTAYAVPTTDGLTVCPDCQNKPMRTASNLSPTGATNRKTVLGCLFCLLAAGFGWFWANWLIYDPDAESRRKQVDGAIAGFERHEQMMDEKREAESRERTEEFKQKLTGEFVPWFKENFGDPQYAAQWYASIGEIQVLNDRIVFLTTLSQAKKADADTIAFTAASWVKQHGYQHQIRSILVKDPNAANIAWRDIPK